MLRSAFLALGAAGALSACTTTTYESQLRQRFEYAGLSRPVSRCMAERLVDRLDAYQLRSLATAIGARRENVGRMTVNQFVRRWGGVLDPEIYARLTQVGIGCTLLG